jgi:UPF0755 protein
MAKKGKKTVQKKTKNTLFQKIKWVSLGVVLLGTLWLVYYTYQSFYSSNINNNVYENNYFYIQSSWKYDDVLKALVEKKIIKNGNTFDWLAKQKNYPNNVKAGKYKIERNYTNIDLINILRSGKQEPVKVKLENFKSKEELIHKVCTLLETDSLELKNILTDDHYLATLGVNTDNALAFFIPNTYEFRWNTSAHKFMTRMQKEFNTFWNANNRATLLKKTKLSKAQAYTLASIVEQETQYKPERNFIAAVYLNRLSKNMLLQADPTVVYANSPLKINRVLKIHLEKDSPYNTYKYAGLPPGPIVMPSQNSIDAVLNFSNKNYLYFCAKEDFSGMHNFANNLNEHNRNASKFQRELNRRGIKQ